MNFLNDYAIYAFLIGYYLLLESFWRRNRQTTHPFLGASIVSIGIYLPAFGYSKAFLWLTLLGGIIAISPVVIRLIGRLSGRRRDPTGPS